MFCNLLGTLSRMMYASLLANDVVLLWYEWGLNFCFRCCFVAVFWYKQFGHAFDLLEVIGSRNFEER